MVDDLYKALLNHKAMSAYSQPENYVFTSSSSRPMNPDTLREVLQSALKKLEIKFDQPRADGMHLLRHTAGSPVYRRTADVKLAQEWLGQEFSDHDGHALAPCLQTSRTEITRPARSLNSGERKEGHKLRGDIIFWFWRITFPCTVIASVLELWMGWRPALLWV